MDYEEKETGERVIDKVLKRLTPENIQKQIQEIQTIELPPDIQKWVEEYEKVGQRNRFFWRWLYFANQIIVFPEVPSEYQESLRETKTLFNMFLALLDDVADKMLNKKLLSELLKIPFNPKQIQLSELNPQEKLYLEFTKKLWSGIYGEIKRYPKYEELSNVFEFDVSQLLNAMQYAYMVNKNPNLINKTEYWIYLSHNMQAIINLTLDLICLSRFDPHKIGILREIAWETQKMARIGNWASTWEREIEDKDFTSGIFAYAIHSGAINPEQLVQLNTTTLVQKIQSLNIEKILWDEWEKSYTTIKNLGIRAELEKIPIFLNALEKLLFLHLSSRGLK